MPKRRLLAKSGTAGSMPNKEYWIARAIERTEHFEDVADGGVNEIVAKYKQAQNQLTDSFENFYDKHGVKDGSQIKLAFNDVVKPLSIKDSLRVKKKASSALKAAGEVDKEYIRSLKQIARTLRLPVSTEFFLDAQIITHDLGIYEEAKLKSLLDESMRESYIMTIDDLTKVLTADQGELTRKWVTEAIYKPWYEENFSDRIWSNRSTLVNKLQQGLLRNIAAGEKAQSITKWIEKQMSTSASNAERLVRTEMKHIVEQGTLDAYKEAGVKKYEYVAVLDEKTTKFICRPLDGKIFKLSDAQVGTNYPPMHPNCRSTTIAII